MTPRPYSSPERQRTVDAGRDRILAAALELMQQGDLAAFSLDAVATRAGITRMTVYNQFGSKAGLFEELFDLLVTRGAFSEMQAIFAEKDVGAAFDAFVAVFGRFYTENRPVMAKMRAAAGSDPDLDAAMRKRNERRKRGIETLVQRLGKQHQPSVPAAELVTTLDVLLSFNTFDMIAGPDRTPQDVVPLLRRLIRGVIGLPKRRTASRAKVPRKKRR
ncbi:MAG TPA: TetR/AcrR family transcriptional regulator [Gemmatimonadaceae bacterium]|jgi:AcrR family transcriptional regulator